MSSCYLCGHCTKLQAFLDKGSIVHLCDDTGSCAMRLQRKQIEAKALRKTKPLPPPPTEPDRRSLSTGSD